jgi:hypothetical protein
MRPDQLAMRGLASKIDGTFAAPDGGDKPGSRPTEARARNQRRRDGRAAPPALSGTIVSPRASIATSVAIFFARPAGVCQRARRSA